MLCKYVCVLYSNSYEFVTSVFITDVTNRFELWALNETSKAYGYGQNSCQRK